MIIRYPYYCLPKHHDYSVFMSPELGHMVSNESIFVGGGGGEGTDCKENNENWFLKMKFKVYHGSDKYGLYIGKTILLLQKKMYHPLWLWLAKRVTFTYNPSESEGYSNTICSVCLTHGVLWWSDKIIHMNVLWKRKHYINVRYLGKETE